VAVVDPPMVDVLIDLRLTRFFFQSTANWPLSQDRGDAAYGKIQQSDAKPHKSWTDPESRTVGSGRAFGRPANLGISVVHGLAASSCACFCPPPIASDHLGDQPRYYGLHSSVP
jgi:hypothetical protein